MLRVLLICSYVLFALPCYSQSNPGYISGKIVNFYGVGVRARIIAYWKMATDGQPHLSGRCLTVTNASGQFSCSTLPVGSYIIEAIPLPKAGFKGRCYSRCDALFYPGVSNLANAQSIFVTAQGAPWVEIQEDDAPATSVTGELTAKLPHVTFNLNTVGAGVEVHLDHVVQYDSKTGRFELPGVMPGRYDLRATWVLNHSKHSAFAIFSLGGNPVSDLHLTPLEKATISGSVEVPDQINVSMILLRPVDVTGSPIQVPVKKDKFQVDDLKTGEYEVEVAGRGNTYISSLRWDGDSIANQPYLQVIRGGAHVLKIVLTGPAGEVVGNLAPSPFTNNTGSADVIAVSEKTKVIYHQLANHTERFSFIGLPPGFYRFYAWSRPNQVPFRIASFRKDYRDDSQELFVDAGALEGVSDLNVINQTP